VAPWAIAGLRLTPLLGALGRTTVVTDIHDQPGLQNQQVVAALDQLRRQRKELFVTYWVADDTTEDCMVEAPLPLLSQELGSARLPRADGSGNLTTAAAREFHTHSDAGLLICRGHTYDGDKTSSRAVAFCPYRVFPNKREWGEEK
jgi:hypothetical protein